MKRERLRSELSRGRTELEVLGTDEANVVRERDRLINIAQTVNLEREMPAIEHLAGAHGGTAEERVQMQGGRSRERGSQSEKADQAERKSTRTQDETFSEWGSMFTDSLASGEQYQRSLPSFMRNLDPNAYTQNASRASSVATRAQQSSASKGTHMSEYGQAAIAMDGASRSEKMHNTVFDTQSQPFGYGKGCISMSGERQSLDRVGRKSLSKHSSVSYTHYSVFDIQSQTEKKVIETADEERLLRDRIGRILSSDKQLAEERKERELAEKKMKERLEQLKAVQSELRKETERQNRLDQMRDEHTRLERQLLEKIQEDRMREARIFEMHRETLRLEEEMKRSGTKHQHGGTHVKVEPAEDRQSNRPESETDRKRQTDEDRRFKMLREIDRQEKEKMREQQQLALKRKVKEKEIRQKAQALKQIDEELERDKFPTSRETNENYEYDKETAELERERSQLINRQMEMQKQTDTGVSLKEKELEKKELYLKQFEQELLRKEEELRNKIRTGDVSTPVVKEEKKADITHFVKPYITPFSGNDPLPKNEATFEDWKVEIQCLIKSGSLPDYAVAQCIRNSLKLPAKKAVARCSPSASSQDLVDKLENTFGNVASGESVLTEFYTSAQKATESITMWSLRLEEIVQRGIDKGQIEESKKDEMLRNRFWRYLCNKELQNATAVHFERMKTFDELRSKVRAEEYWRNPSTVESSASKVTDGKLEKAGASAPVQHQPIQLDPHAIANKDIVSRLEKIEKTLSYRRNRGRQRNQYQRTGNQQNQTQQNQQNQNAPNQQNMNQNEQKKQEIKTQEQSNKTGQLNR